MTVRGKGERGPPRVFEASSSRDPFQVLAAEHALIRLQLARAIDAARSGEDGASARAAIASLADGFRLHQRREDLVMYPVCERLFGGPEGVASVLRDDHAEIEQLLSTLADGRGSSGLAAGAALEDLRRLCEVHFVREERVLFPLMTAYLAGKESAELARRLRAQPTA